VANIYYAAGFNQWERTVVESLNFLTLWVCDVNEFFDNLHTITLPTVS